LQQSLFYITDSYVTSLEIERQQSERVHSVSSSTQSQLSTSWSHVSSQKQKTLSRERCSDHLTVLLTVLF